MPRRFLPYDAVRLVATLSVATAACATVPAWAQSSDFSGVAALSSQLVDRGVAITTTTPTMQGAVTWTSPSGWSFGVAGGTEVKSPGEATEVLAQASRSWALSGDWQLHGGVSYYRYSRRDSDRIYDRSEADVSWIYRDVLTLGLSAVRVMGANDDRPRPALDIDVHWPLMWQLSLTAGAGAAYAVTVPYTRYGQAYGGVAFYHYGHAGLMWAHGAWRIEMERIGSDLDGRRAGHPPTMAPWVATISRSF